MVNVYIDESGNLGRGGEFFTIAAIAFATPQGLNRMKRLMKKSCLVLSTTNTPLREIKSNSLSIPQKQELLLKMSKRPDHEIFYITAQKKHVTMLQQGRDKNLVYNYLAGILTREITKKYDDDICIYFDQHTTKVASVNSLKDYIRIEEYKRGFRHELQVGYFDSHSMYNLQAADMIAGAVNSSYMMQNKHLLSIIRGRVETQIEFPQAKFDKSLV